MKNFQPKKKDDEDNQFSYFRGFNRMSGETHDLAAQHERLAEDLQGLVLKVQSQGKELREERRKVRTVLLAYQPGKNDKSAQRPRTKFLFHKILLQNAHCVKEMILNEPRLRL